MATLRPNWFLISPSLMASGQFSLSLSCRYFQSVFPYGQLTYNW